MIYRPPGQLGTFLEELDGLLSSFPEDGRPLIVFGDFNINLSKHYAVNFLSLLASFDLKRLTTTSTHKSGSQLDLIYKRNCIADNILVKPLHTSDHYFITFNLDLTTSEPPTHLPVTFRRNLCSLSPSHLNSVVSSSLPSPTHFSALDVNAATETLCSTLTSCLDHIYPLTSRPARAALSNPWCIYDVFREHRSKLRAAENKWRKSKDPSDPSIYQSLLSSFSAEVHTSTTRSTAHLTRNLFKTFNSLLCHWFEPYLTGRSFRVAWGGEVSKAHQLVTGVPQGLVLGPLLFFTYTTSLGFPRDQFLDPPSSPHTLHHWVPSYRHMASPTIATLMTHSSTSHFDLMIQR